MAVSREPRPARQGKTAKKPPRDIEAMTFLDGVFWRCLLCRRVGRENWSHVCDRAEDAPHGTVNNWYVSADALRVAESARLPRSMKRPFLSSGPVVSPEKGRK